MPYKEIEIIGEKAKDFGNYNTSLAHIYRPGYKYVVLASRNGSKVSVAEADNFEELVDSLLGCYCQNVVARGASISCRGLGDEDSFKGSILWLLELASQGNALGAPSLSSSSGK